MKVAEKEDLGNAVEQSNEFVPVFMCVFENCSIFFVRKIGVSCSIAHENENQDF